MRLLISITIFIFSSIIQAQESVIEPLVSSEENSTINVPITIEEDSAIDLRIKQEKKLQQVSFSLTPYKPNYLLPLVYNEKIFSYDVYSEGEDKMRSMEVEFQISFKVPALIEIADLPLSIFLGYTQVSFWQAYNTQNSSPFRETNYEPEVFAVWQQDVALGADWHFKIASIGFSHQSNGRTEPLSRSWNRLNAEMVFENNNFVVAFNPWYRFSESESEDNNPDLLDYYGHGKITFAYKLAHHTFSLMTRNNIESGFKKGAIRASWSFPINKRVRGYLQVFSGYGNSMLEYDEYTNTIGVGIALTDWF